MAAISNAYKDEDLEGLSMTLEEVDQRYEANRQYTQEIMKSFEENNTLTIAPYFEHVCAKYSNQICLISHETGHQFTFQQVHQLSNEIAHWIDQTLSLLPGDTVTLLMENDPLYIITWLALAKLGLSVALLSTSIEGSFLHEAKNVVSPKYNFISSTYMTRWLQSHPSSSSSSNKPLLKDTFIIKYSSFVPYEGDTFSFEGQELYLPSLLRDPTSSFQESISCDVTTYPLKAKNGLNKVHKQDPLLFIYTSGTTGKSKAARFNHQRFIGAGVTWGAHMQMTSKDKYYNCLPLFHGNGGVVAVSTCFLHGVPMVIRKKFSASNFFKDIRQHSCTATITIGEIWNYILSTPRTAEDKNHSLRVSCGNGLRKDTWRSLIERYGHISIVEHYGQTEMPSSHPMINSFGVYGSCGYIPLSVRNDPQGAHIELLVVYDYETGSAKREDGTGYLVKALPNERGDVIGESVVCLIDNFYSGYSSKECTARVLYRNCFKPNDLYYHSNDILRINKHGFFYFVDRAGDSYRYKGENVSLTEVTNVMEKYCAEMCEEINLYGVTLPHDMENKSNKIGMASIRMKQGCEDHKETVLSTITTKVYPSLPTHAYPYVVRFRNDQNDVTSTLKFKKHLLSEEGIFSDSIQQQGDDVYFFVLQHVWNAAQKAFTAEDNISFNTAAALQTAKGRWVQATWETYSLLQQKKIKF